MAEIKKISTELQILNKFLDTSGDAGTSQKILRSTGTGVDWFSGFSSVYTVGTVGSGAAWRNMGTFTASQGGKSIFIKIVSNNGYNATISQNYEVYIRFKTSNGGSTDANGFAADSSFYTTGPSGSLGGGNIKWVANAAGTSATAYTLYVLFPQFTGDGSFYVAENSTGTWVNSGATATDPGAASSTILIPQEQFRVGSTDFVVNGGGGDAYFANSNVGIGTTSPTGYRLVVENTSEDLLKLHNSTDGLDSLISFTNPGGTLARIQGVDNGGLGFDVGNNAGGIISNAMFVKNNGNVGIGTTSPQSKLQIQANQHAADPGGKDYTGSAINADGGDIATGKLFLQGYQKTANDLCGFNNEADRVVLYNYTDARYLQLWNHTGDTNIPSGNLGIGMTTNPNSRLDVRRAGSGVALELHQTSGSANDYVDLKMIAGNTNAGTFGTILRHKRNGSGGGDFSILTNPTLTGTPIERMRITSAGYVGINCTPSYKLQWSDGTRTGLLDTNIGAVVIGSVSNDALALYTNLTEKMRIRPSGTVGIGHSGYDSQMLTIAAGTLDGAIYATSTDANCFASFRDNSSTANIEYGAIGNNHVFRKDASEQMRITSTGNVGIGTTSPTGKLEIQRSQVTTQFDRDSFLRLHPTTTTNSGGFTNIFFGTSPVNNYGVAIGGLRAGTDGTPSFSVRMLNDSITGTEVLNINNAGSVKFNAYNGTNNTGSPTHILGTDANGLIVKSTAGSSIGPWLPLAAGPNEPLTNSLYISSSGANGLILKKDTSAGSNSGRLFFQTDTAAEGVCIMNANGRLDFRTSSDPINTSGNIKMVLTNGGRLGIGVTSPVSALDVLGKINQTTSSGGTAASFTNSDATNGYGVAIQSQGTAATRYALILRNLDSTNIYGGVSTMTNQVGFWGIGASPTNTLGSRLTVGGNASIGSSYTATSAPTNGLIVEGNVGIGMTNPAVPLDVEGKIRSNDSNSGDYLEIFCDGSVSGDSYIENTNNNIQIKSAFATSFSTSGSVAMFINNSQNVGIGTTSPGTKLVIEGTNDAAGTGVVEIKTTGTNLKIGGNTTYSWIQSHASKPLYINQLGNNVILNSGGGNVGIGTTSPSAKLSVVGDINFGGGNNNGIIEVSGSGDLIFKYKGSDPALTLDGGAVKTIVHNRLDALNVVNINNPSNNESILNIRDDDSSSNGHIAFENSSEVTGIVSSGTDFINFRAGDGVAITDSPMLTLLNNRIGINTTSPNSNVALDVDGRVLIKDSNGVADFYLGNYATANHFRFHTNNANTYFDMNCGNIYWRDGASTRYTFFPSTANMTVNGTITQNSDARVKENVVEISDCISKVQAMKGVYYNRTDFNTEATKVGVIAQDVEAVLPELIIESPEDGLKSVAYSELTAVLINAIKEQQEIIEDLKTRITKLEN
jgi:hypothetical protein